MVSIRNNRFRDNRGREGGKGRSVFLEASGTQKVTMQGNRYSGGKGGSGENVFVRYKGLSEITMIEEVAEEVTDNVVAGLRVFSPDMESLEEGRRFTRQGVTFSKQKGVYRLEGIQSGHHYGDCLLKVLLYDRHGHPVDSQETLLFSLEESPPGQSN